MSYGSSYGRKQKPESNFFLYFLAGAGWVLTGILLIKPDPPVAVKTPAGWEQLVPNVEQANRQLTTLQTSLSRVHDRTQEQIKFDHDAADIIRAAFADIDESLKKILTILENPPNCECDGCKKEVAKVKPVVGKPAKKCK